MSWTLTLCLSEAKDNNSNLLSHFCSLVFFKIEAVVQRIARSKSGESLLGSSQGAVDTYPSDHQIALMRVTKLSAMVLILFPAALHAGQTAPDTTTNALSNLRCVLTRENPSGQAISTWSLAGTLQTG